ncbi:MAG: hypothetical protein RMJ88_17050, partial [Thermogemmata sp.]|nr:hypothetical protein [Thermogemmata sp.]
MTRSTSFFASASVVSAQRLSASLHSTQLAGPLSDAADIYCAQRLSASLHSTPVAAGSATTGQSCSTPFG